MANEQIITCGDGITLRTTDDGTALCTGDCENAPPPCCNEENPSPCGRRWMVCFSRYRYRHERVASSAPYGVLTERVTEDMNGGPFAYQADVDAFGCSTAVTDELPIVRVEEAFQVPGTVEVPPIDHTRRVEYLCRYLGVICGELAGVACLRPSSFPIAFSAVAAGGLERATYYVHGCEVGSTSVPVVPQPPDGTVVPPTTQVVSRSFRFGAGLCFYRESVVVTEYLYQYNPFRPEVPPYVLTIRTEQSVEIEYTLHIIEDCNGNTYAHCTGETQTGCTGTETYIRAEPCPGQTNPPPVVFLARNVAACRTMPVGAFCYNVGPQYPRTNDPGNATIDDRIVMAHSGSPDCCACLQCGNTIETSPCWLNFARSPDGTPIITPAFIEDGHCCCDPFDTITIAQADNTLIGFGQRQEWRLRGTPLSFLRNRVEAVPGNQLISDVSVYDENAPDGSPPISTFAFFHGQFLNDPPMGCQWDQLGTTAFQFATPADGVLAAPIGVNGALPCPIDPNGERGPWRLILWSVSVTCRTFQFRGEWVNVGNGLRLTTRSLFNVTPPPDFEFRRCGGGCVKRPIGDAPAPGPRPALPGGLIGGDLRDLIGGG